MITSCKFNIGQQVRHKLLGFLGVIVDIDPEYSLLETNIDELNIHNSFKKYPWYHVIMEDDNGYTIHTYLSEIQLSWETQKKQPNKSSLYELSKKIKKTIKNSKI